MQKKCIYKIITIIAIIALLVTTQVYAASLPTSFNLSDKIKITVKDQKTTGACWALAMTTVFETNLALRNGKQIEISARHMDYATSQSFLNDKYNEKGFSREANSGGRGDLALAYFTNGSGPILESQMPFSETFGDIAISEITRNKVTYKVNSWVQLPSIYKTTSGQTTTYYDKNNETYTKAEVEEIRTQIKEHIKNYGAVYTGLHAGANWKKYFNSSTAGYYCNQKEIPDHALVIIGWDDNYPKENFNKSYRPQNDGAYIVQNSWGMSKDLINGTFYVSYEDINIEEDLYGILEIEQTDEINIYQHDELGMNQYYNILGLDAAYGANVFTRKTEKTEHIKEIGLNNLVEVGCEIYVNPIDGELDEAKIIKVAEVDKLHIGYQAVKLESPVEIKGKEFAVIVKYKRINDQELAITTVTRHTSSTTELVPYENVSSNPGESYIGGSIKKMQDLYYMDSSNTNVCIKAITVEKLAGDVNGDNKISALDLSILKLYVIGIKTFTVEEKKRADINEDGKITAVDLSRLQNILVGL